MTTLPPLTRLRALPPYLPLLLQLLLQQTNRLRNPAIISGITFTTTHQMSKPLETIERTCKPSGWTGKEATMFRCIKGQCGSPNMSSVKSLLDLFAVLWFIVGNYFLFTSNDCARLAPTLFYTTLVWVLLGYLLILIPLFLCASVIFCLPCVLGRLMRTLGAYMYTHLLLKSLCEHSILEMCQE